MRRKPYTEIGIRRMKCYRCGNPARFQWQICADGNVYRPICGPCDIDLNWLVLKWLGLPERRARAMIAAYQERHLSGEAR